MKRLFALLLLILFTTAAVAYEGYELTSYEAEYEIVGNTVIVIENLKIDEPLNNLHWIVPKDATAIEVKGLLFEIHELNSYKSLLIDAPTTEITVKYISPSALEENKDYFFILDISNVKTENKQLTLKLPEGATLKHALDSPTTSIIPNTNNVKTDGKRIIITWTPENLKDNNAILTIFNPNAKDYTPIVATVFIILLLALWIFKNKRQPKKETVEHIPAKPKQESELTRNLFEEEKQIVDILLQSETKELWQKQLEIKTGLSKVKLSRKLRNLEQKGVIEKIPYGNTNKIRLQTPSKD